MQSMDLSGLDKLLAELDSIEKEYPLAKKNLMVDIGNEILGIVLRNIHESGMNITKGALAGFQDRHIGSRNGYAAVRPNSSPAGKDGAGAITNYTNNGHRVRPPSRSREGTWRYRPRRKALSVDGYHYYDKAAKEVASWDTERFRTFLLSYLKRLEGGTT